jgi:hypothetical protein
VEDIFVIKISLPPLLLSIVEPKTPVKVKYPAT